MENYFDVWLFKDLIFIRPRLYHLPFKIYVNHICITSGIFNEGLTFRVDNPAPDTVITIEYLMHHRVKIDRYSFRVFYAARNGNYEPGDILVSSDNVKSWMTGYIGHSAIVINEKELIESAAGEHSAVLRDSIHQFVEKHPIHAHFRPKNKALGKKAADYAVGYHQQYMENLKNGINKPVYSFKLSESLEDPWEKTYCSKLVWLAYHYGAGYTFENDYLWFSPEDLYHNLIKNKDFQLIYQHEDVSFYINT